MSTRTQPAPGSGRQPATVEQKAFRLEIKDITSTGQFTGRAAVFGNIDAYDDVIVPGAFTKTLSENAGAGWPILWQHDSYEPVGLIEEASQTDQALDVVGQINLDVRRGVEAHSLLKQKAIKGLSIGYEAVQQTFDGMVRFLREVKLWEVSLATFPANELAVVDSVKGYTHALALVDQIKAGRVLSQANFDRLSAVVGEISALLEDATVAPAEGAAPDDKSSTRGEPATQATPDAKSLVVAVTGMYDRVRATVEEC
jgi:HK97 family phage prohead protease